MQTPPHPDMFILSTSNCQVLPPCFSYLVMIDDFMLAETNLACIANAGANFTVRGFVSLGREEESLWVVDQTSSAEEEVMNKVPGRQGGQSRRGAYVGAAAGATQLAGCVEVHHEMKRKIKDFFWRRAAPVPWEPCAVELRVLLAPVGIEGPVAGKTKENSTGAS